MQALSDIVRATVNRHTEGVKPRIYLHPHGFWVCADFRGSARWALGLSFRQAYDEWLFKCTQCDASGRSRPTPLLR